MLRKLRVVIATLIIGAVPPTAQTVPVPPADEVRCFEDAVKVLVVWDVAPDNGVPPGLDWQRADGRMMCATANDLYVLD